MTTAVVGALLFAHVAPEWWEPGFAQPPGLPLALIGAAIGGGRIIHLALAAMLEGRVGADSRRRSRASRRPR